VSELTLFDLSGLPTEPGRYRQLSVTFEGFGDNAERRCRVVLPNNETSTVDGHIAWIGEQQRKYGLTPDVTVEARTVTCGEWGPQ
jgi:hypothetical protein